MIVDEDIYLKHYGVKGMRWGQRKAARQRNRELNRATKAKEKARAQREFNKARTKLRPSNKPQTFDTSTKAGREKAREARRADIDRARARVAIGATKADLKDAKSEYRRNKAKIGSRAAKNILREKRGAIYADINRSREIRDGKEMALAIIGVVGNSLANSRRV